MTRVLSDAGKVARSLSVLLSDSADGWCALLRTTSLFYRNRIRKTPAKIMR